MTDDREGAGDSAFTELDRPPLDARTLRRLLRAGEAGSWWRSVDVVASTASTNADLVAAARDGAGEGTVLIAEHQRAGRGRLGRGWQAPPRSALTLSVLLWPRVPAARWPWLPLLAGVATAEAVTRATGVEAVLKWPNDVVVDDRKLAGILVERLVTVSGPAAVVGIGLNVSMRPDEKPVPMATSLAVESGGPIDRQPLLLQVLRTLEAVYRAWTAADGDPGHGLHASYVRRCATLGEQVRVTLPGDTVITGLAEAIDGGGQLVVRTDHGQRALGAGDVLHVRGVV